MFSSIDAKFRLRLFPWTNSAFKRVFSLADILQVAVVISQVRVYFGRYACFFLYHKKRTQPRHQDLLLTVPFPAVTLHHWCQFIGYRNLLNASWLWTAKSEDLGQSERRNILNAYNRFYNRPLLLKLCCQKRPWINFPTFVKDSYKEFLFS